MAIFYAGKYFKRDKVKKAPRTIQRVEKPIQADRMNGADTLESSDDDQVNRTVFKKTLTLYLSLSVDPESGSQTHFWTIWLRKKG